MVRPLAALMAFGAMAYVSVAAVTAAFQRDFIYHPSSHHPVPPPAFQESVVGTSDGSLAVWYRPAAPGRPTVVFFDGNAGSLPGAVLYTKPLADDGYGLLLASYPGYDGNPGEPTESGLYAAGRAAMAWLDSHGISEPVIAGYSLGTGVAVQMAAEHAAQALLLLAPYSSISSMARQRMPLLPTDLLLRDRFESIGKIERIHVPVLIVHGDADPVIPIEEGRSLFAAANQPKRMVVQPKAGHEPAMAPVVRDLDALLAKARE